MYALTFDQRGSRRSGDRVPELLDALRPLPVRLPAERTVGDEAQVLVDRAETALQCALAALELGEWSIGIGVGPVETPLPGNVREARGDALRASRAAIDGARSTGEVPVVVRASDPRHATTAADAQAVLRLTGWMIRTRTEGQWRTVRLLRDDPRLTQQQLAERLGITQQSVSRSLATSGWREERAAHGLVERLLAMIDLTS